MKTRARFRPGMTQREAKWVQCNWPHEIMSPEYEAALTRIIDEWRPWIAKRARWLAGGNEELADELEQCALIRLWRDGVEALAEQEPKYTRRVLRHEMQKALIREARELVRVGHRALPYG